MATQTQTNDIQVPALMDGDNVVIPQFCLARDVKYRRDEKNYPLSAAEYNSQMTLPTLAELRHAFFDKNPNGSWTCPEYKKSVLEKYSYGEWTSTFLQDGEMIVENPKNVVYRNGVWVLEGGKVTHVKLPPNGWALEYDKRTGFPSKTSNKRTDAEEIFDGDTSYFYHTNSGVSAVFRDFFLDNDGPFHIHAEHGPGNCGSLIGGRACRRSK